MSKANSHLIVKANSQIWEKKNSYKLTEQHCFCRILLDTVGEVCHGLTNLNNLK